MLSDVLLGTVSPSGKLTDTWAEDYYDYPSSRNFSHNNGDTSDEYYTDGIYVGYRYFDSFGVKPWYPFGFGLSYTDFSITVKDISVKGENVSVQAAVEKIQENLTAEKKWCRSMYARQKGGWIRPSRN